MALPLSLDEAQGRGVHAVAEAGGFGPVIEDVPEMSVASAARDGRPGDAQAEIRMLFDVLFRKRRPEARPAGPGFEFRVRAEQRRVAADAAVQAFVVKIPVRSGKRPLGAGTSSDLKRERRE